MRKMLAIGAAAMVMAASPPSPTTGRVAYVTDGDTFRLESGERIRIAGIDAPETHRDQARCAAEVTLGLRAKERATTLLGGRSVTFRRVGRSYNRTVATVVLDGRDLAAELVQLGVAAWWPRGRPKPFWCG